MKMTSMALVLVLLASSAVVSHAEQDSTNPMAMVISMCDDLAAKVRADGEAEEKAYGEYFEWCDDTTKNLFFEIKTATAKKEKLEAKIEKLTADIDDSNTKIEELVASIAQSTKELEDATTIRNKEHADFLSAEAELVDGIDTLGRAIGIIDREASKNPAALAQIDTSNMNNALKAISTVLDAAGMIVADKDKLVGFIQSRQQNTENSDDEDKELGAPAPSVYKSHSGGILDVLEEMKEKAEEELSTLRKEEMNTKNNFEMLKQSLEDAISADNKDKSDETASMEADQEAKATAEGDLSSTKKALAQAQGDLEDTQHACMQTASDHEVSKAGRAQELKVIAEAKKILEDTAKGAAEQSYSLFQVSSKSRQHMSAASKEVTQLVSDLARKEHSAALAQLASKIEIVIKYSQASGGDDPFAKIKGLISDMIAKLEKEAEADAKEKAYCDEQMSKTEAKKSELDEDIEKLKSKIDKAAASSTTLKEEVKLLQEELAKLAKEQKEMDKIRADQNKAYLKASGDLKLGLQGVRAALEKLRDYYGGSAASMLQGGSAFSMHQPKMPEFHGAATGAGGGIIGMLEVCESDFSKNLAEVEKEEADEVEYYEKTTQENEIAKTTKTQDVKYKTQEFIGLDKQIADLTADKETAQTEHDAVMEYYAKIKDRCIAKPESYEEIKKRRDAEIKGLKEALAILEGEAAFNQGRKRGFHHRYLRAMN